jgi:hypothetical protein
LLNKGSCLLLVPVLLLLFLLIVCCSSYLIKGSPSPALAIGNLVLFHKGSCTECASSLDDLLPFSINEAEIGCSCRDLLKGLAWGESGPTDTLGGTGSQGGGISCVVYSCVIIHIDVTSKLWRWYLGIIERDLNTSLSQIYI